MAPLGLTLFLPPLLFVETTRPNYFDKLVEVALTSYSIKNRDIIYVIYVMCIKSDMEKISYFI